MNKVYLIGFMGVGKSTVGKKLASLLNYEFIDTDNVFEKKYKLGIDTFFSKYGEDLFRKLEHEILLSTFSKKHCIVSTGGGMPCYLDSIQQINNNGLSVYLQMNEKAILSRLLSSKQKRPLLKNMNENELLIFINNSLIKRNPYYCDANITVPALSIGVDDLARQIQEGLQ